MSGANVAILLLAALPLALVAVGYYYLRQGTHQKPDRQLERYRQVQEGQRDEPGGRTTH